MKLPHHLLTLLLSAATAWSVTRYVAPASPSTQKTETAFERVMRTGVLRCGYCLFSPATMRDPNTGKMHGMSIEMMELFSRNSGLKVEWTEETDWSNWVMGLAAERFDAMCTPMWPDSNLARVALFTRSFMYASINAYVRDDDHRFDNNLAAINAPAVTVISFENDATTTIAKGAFPKAKLIVLSAGSPTTMSAEELVAKKVDVLLTDENSAFLFNKNSPKKIRNVAPATPLKVMPFELLVGINEPQLRDLLDVGIQELLDSGEMDKLIDKWQSTPTSFIRTAKPYDLK